MHLPVRQPDNSFVYLFEGQGRFNGTALKTGECAFFSDVDKLAVEAASKPVRFIFASGKPLREPVAWQGPIVMNTDDELETAFREYQEGTFIK
jgi:redox-sensitive bicupin YhaK (pirin superfamily)